eukprot:SAG11_NODE_8142_length_1055_cov_1.459205_3_plen_75_part_01
MLGRLRMELSRSLVLFAAEAEEAMQLLFGLGGEKCSTLFCCTSLHERTPLCCCRCHVAVNIFGRSGGDELGGFDV